MFNISIHQWTAERIRRAEGDVAALPDSAFLDGSLAARLDSIAAKYTLRVASLAPDQKRGKRERSTRDIMDYGQSRQIEVTTMHITIPFNGSHDSFALQPSSMTLVNRPVTVTRDGLVVTFPDDDRLKSELETFISTISATLSHIEREMASVPQQIRSAIEGVAAQRAVVVQAQRARDQSLGFPVT